MNATKVTKIRSTSAATSVSRSVSADKSKEAEYQLDELKSRKSGLPPKMWTDEEDNLLRQAIQKHGERNWKLVAQNVPGRNYIQCLQRWKKSLRPGLRKGHWSEAEDEKLLQLVKQYEPNWDWAMIAKLIPGRSAKQCRERWFLNLDPSINHGPWTPEEDHQLLEFVRLNGGKWSLIAKHMPGRTENSVKTRYYSLERKKARKQSWTTAEDTHIINGVLSYGRDFALLDKELKNRTKGQIKKRFAFLSQKQPDLMNRVIAVEKTLRKKRKADTTIRELTNTPSSDRMEVGSFTGPKPKQKRMQHHSSSSWLKGIAQNMQESDVKPHHMRKTLSTTILQEIIKPESNAPQSAESLVKSDSDESFLYNKLTSHSSSDYRLRKVNSLEILQHLLSDPNMVDSRSR